MAADSELVRNYLHRLRQQFYPDNERGFWLQQSVLKDAITTPARWLDDRHVRLPERRLCEILDEIILGIMHHGDTGKIDYFCRYFLHAVQLHMKHHEEKYYEEGKSLRFITDTAMENLSKKQRAKLADAQDATTSRLAELNRLIRETTAKKKRTAKSPAAQLDLL